MEFNELKQLIESNARVILGHEQRLTKLTACSIVEGCDQLELLQRVKHLEQTVLQLKGNSQG